MCSYKSLVTYKYFAAQWVLNVGWWQYSECTLVVGKVCHNYSSKTPLRPWVHNHQTEWICCMLSLHMHGRTRWNLLSHWSSSLLVGDTYSYQRSDTIHLKGKHMDWMKCCEGYHLFDTERYWFHFCQEVAEVYPWRWRGQQIVLLIVEDWRRLLC